MECAFLRYGSLSNCDDVRDASNVEEGAILGGWYKKSLDELKEIAGSVSDNVISYIEMCSREGASLQAGMNFGLGGNHSVILMSVRPNAPYRDRLEDGGTTLIYEGHDEPKSAAYPNPKVVDQPLKTGVGSRTANSLQRRRTLQPAAAARNGFASTKRFGRVFGRTTESST